MANPGVRIGREATDGSSRANLRADTCAVSTRWRFGPCDCALAFGGACSGMPKCSGQVYQARLQGHVQAVLACAPVQNEHHTDFCTFCGSNWSSAFRAWPFGHKKFTGAVGGGNSTKLATCTPKSCLRRSLKCNKAAVPRIRWCPANLDVLICKRPWACASC